MTMSLTGKKRRNRGRAGLPNLRPKAAGGFTIVELMVVMLIMLLLLAVLAPTVQKIHRTVMRVTALTTVRLIEGGCRGYYEDFGEFPHSNNYLGWEGKELLVLFMTGYGPDLNSDGKPTDDANKDGLPDDIYTDDGRAGLGFRTEKAGHKFGPYNGTQDIKKRLSETNSRPVFVDAFDEEIYYYRYDPTFPAEAPFGYYATDNPGGPFDDHDDYNQGHTDFVLATAGPDGVFEAYDDVLDTDDITNFLEEQH